MKFRVKDLKHSTVVTDPGSCLGFAILLSLPRYAPGRPLATGEAPGSRLQKVGWC